MIALEEPEGLADGPAPTLVTQPRHRAVRERIAALAEDIEEPIV